MKVKKKSEKSGLKLYIQKTRIVASGSITSSQVNGGIVEIVTVPKSLQTMTAAMKLKDACSLEEKL